MGARNSKAKAASYAKKHGDHDQPQKQNKEVKDIVYYVTPLSIGYGDSFDEMVVLIPRNTRIPTEKFASVTTTTCDNQEAMKFSFYQGERKKASANQLLGTLTVMGIPPAPNGVAKITVSVDVDAKGNLNVSASDKSTGKKLASESIAGVGVKGKLTEEEVEKMAQQGEKHKSEDEEHLKEVKVIKAMKEHAIMIRENAAAGAFSEKAYYAFKDVTEKMLDEFKEKAKEFGSEGAAAVLSTATT